MSVKVSIADKVQALLLAATIGLPAMGLGISVLTRLSVLETKIDTMQALLMPAQRPLAAPVAKLVNEATYHESSSIKSDVTAGG